MDCAVDRMFVSISVRDGRCLPEGQSKRGYSVMIEVFDDKIRGALKKSIGWIPLIVLIVLSTGIFYYTAIQQRYAIIDELTSFKQAEFIRITSISFVCVFVLTALFQLRELKRLSLFHVILALLVTGLIILGKISLLDYQSNDYEIFLSGWIYEYTQLPLWNAIGTYIGSDYSPPYLYFLALMSRLTVFPWLYLIKALSAAFDALLAFSIMKMVGLRWESPVYRIGTYLMTLLLPTVVFNGTYWGQCDVIYTSLCMMAVYLALRQKSIGSFLLFGIALSFKLQTVFFLPVLLPLWLHKDIKLRWIVLIPVGYMLMMIPALLAGKSLHHVLTVFLQQAGQYNFITMNGPSVYELFLQPTQPDSGVFYEMFSQMAMFLAFGAVLGISLLLCIYRRRLNAESILLSALLYLSVVPFLLPKMHERYSFGADVMAMAVCMWNPRRRFVLPILFGLSSYFLYTSGLAGEAVLLPQMAVLFYAAGIGMTLIELITVLRESSDAELSVI